MQIALTAEQQAMQQEVRSYMRGIMDEAMEAEKRVPGLREGGGPVFREKFARMGADGWIGLSWPKSMGGRELTTVEQYIFTDEVIRAGFPYPFLTTESVAPTLAEFGQNPVREQVLEEIREGRALIAIGYSEPGAGTDLASLKTRAERHGDDWLINGQKMWTSLGDHADYVWLAARTDPDPASKHKGLTMFLVPTSDPGFSWTPVKTLGVGTTATYYSDIRLPDSYRVGEINGGWKLITGQLNRERLSLVTHGQFDAIYQGVRDWAAATPVGDQRLIDQSWVQLNLAKVRSGLEALRLMCWKQAWSMDVGTVDMAAASVAKVYGSELFVEVYRWLLEIMQQAGTVGEGSPGAVLRGELEFRYRAGSVLTFGGGTNEVQRDIIAMAGLWMPRSR